MVTKPHATDAVDVDRLITELLEHLLSSDEEKKKRYTGKCLLMFLL